MMLIVIGLGFYTGAIHIPFSLDVYSPPAAFMSPSRATGRVYGRAVYENGTAAKDIRVRLFATDQLIEDIVFTDEEGYFMSDEEFCDGQIITIAFGEEYRAYQSFIPYDMEYDFTYDMGTFVVLKWNP